MKVLAIVSLLLPLFGDFLVNAVPQCFGSCRGTTRTLGFGGGSSSNAGQLLTGILVGIGLGGGGFGGNNSGRRGNNSGRRGNNSGRRGNNNGRRGGNNNQNRLLRRLDRIVDRLTKRSVDEDLAAGDGQDWFLQASLVDTSDCMKRYICEVSARPLDETKMSPVEQAIHESFAKTLKEMDTTKTTVEFDLASVIGSTVGSDQCQLIYGRCPANFQTLRQDMEAWMDQFDDQQK